MPSIEISRSYRWDPATATVLLAALQDLSQHVNGSDVWFFGSIDDRSEGRHKIRFEEASEFLEFAARAAGFDLTFRTRGDGETSVRFGRYSADARPDLVVSGPLAKQDDTLAAIAAFEHATALTPLNDDATTDAEEPAPKIALPRRYRPAQADSLVTLALFEQHIVPIGGAAAPRVHASIERDAPVADRIDLATLEQVRAHLGRPFRTARINVWFQSDNVSLNIDRRRTTQVEIEVSVPASRQAAALAAIAAFEQASGFSALLEGDDQKPRSGLKVERFTTSPMTVEWLDRLLAALNANTTVARHADVRLQVRGGTPEKTFGDIAIGIAAAREQWADLLVLHISAWGDPHDLLIIVEPKLDLVTLDVRAATDIQVRAVIDQLDRALDLEEWGTLGYRNAATSRRYRFRTFARDDVARVFRIAIQDFVSKDPVLQPAECYVEETNAEGNMVYTRYERLEEFIDRIGGAKDFNEAKVVALGPRSRVVSFVVSEHRSRLDVRSSFDAARFQDLAKALERQLPLVEYKDETAESSAPKTTWQQIKSLDGLWGKGVVALATAIGAAIPFVADRVISRDTLVLIAPSSVADGKRSVAAGCIVVEWEVRGRALFDDDRTLLRETGTLQIDDGDGRRAATLERFRSGEQLRVPEGSWVLYVHDPVRQRRSPSVAILASRPPAGADTIQAGGNTPQVCVK